MQRQRTMRACSDAAKPSPCGGRLTTPLRGAHPVRRTAEAPSDKAERPCPALTDSRHY